jgi:hypothetical protein
MEFTGMDRDEQDDGQCSGIFHSGDSGMKAPLPDLGGTGYTLAGESNVEAAGPYDPD